MAESLAENQLPSSPVEIRGTLFFPRCIVVNGQVCTGSSALTTELARKLNFGIFPTGKIIRRASRMWCKGSWEDFLTNHKDMFYSKTVDRIHNASRIIVEGRLVALQAAKASQVLKILCTASDEVVLKRYKERNNLNESEVENAYRQRLEKDRAILEGIWGYSLTELFDRQLYDVVVNTSQYSPEQIAEEIISKFV